MCRLRVVLSLLVFAVTFHALTLPSDAVDFVVTQHRGKRVLLIRDEQPSNRFPRGGMILLDDAKRFEDALREAGPIAEVLFHSGGGSELDGLEIGRIIRRKGLSTRIPAGASCACADAFLGGVARRVESDGRYGIHMPTIAGNPETVQKILRLIEQQRASVGTKGAQKIIFEIEKLSAQAASRWAAYVLQMGASHRIVDAGTKYLASEMNWLSRKELLDLNIVNVDD